jgi:hypothetical protein
MHLRKLVGKEDPFHIHKTLGFFTTVHFLYRATLALGSPQRGMGFQYRNPLDLAGLACHAALSGTSLVFHIPTNRVKGAPMIWPEFRLHSILFAYRALWILFCHVVFPTWTCIVRPVSVIGTLVAADMVSHHYKKQGLIHPDQTTMRSMPFPPNISQTMIRTINFFYSSAQVYATLNMLYASPESVFLTLFPIQFAAFWMTLVRKGFLTAGQWHLFYTLSLLSNFLYGLVRTRDVMDFPGIYYNLFGFMFILGRFYYHVNKYYLWCCIIFCGYFVEL